MNKDPQLLATRRRRQRAEARFRFYGRAALGFATLMLVYLVYAIAKPGISGFVRHELAITLPAPSAEAMAQGSTLEGAYAQMNQAVRATLNPPPAERVEKRKLTAMLGTFAALDWRAAMRAYKKQPPQGDTITMRVALADDIDQVLKGRVDVTLPETLRPVKDGQLAWLRQWQQAGLVHAAFNGGFFTGGDSRAPESAGVGGAIMGTLFTLFVCMLVAFPVGVAAAIYLEEFAPKNWLTEILEICINNLAAVPSIIYGLLGLSVFLNSFGMPRSASLVGGATLALLVLPVMIIATRASLRAVPPGMRLAASALGASRLQVVKSHVIPYALPGMMTGAILAMARAIGETAPLLMIGMVAFIADVPRTILDAATVLPVQVYIWSSSPELGFVEKTSSAILVLLVLLMALNSVAILIRKRFELTW